MLMRMGKPTAISTFTVKEGISIFIFDGKGQTAEQIDP